MGDVLEVWVDTGEVVERDYTPEELEQRKIDEKTAKDRAKQQAAEEARQAEARAAAIAHAKTLGFTDEMIAVMYPGLTAE
jgi:hypothetical protein